MSRWYKCDLQVATPWGNPPFRLPGLDLETSEGIRRAAQTYVETIKSSGVEVFAVTDHNTVDGCRAVRQAALGAGLIMFPGVEITAGSGVDGVHLLLIADPETDIDTFWADVRRVAGFTTDHPPIFDNQPIPAPRSMIDILNDLPNHIIAIAPHVLTDNGMANARVVKGTLRWRQLHHDRLEAIDVGRQTGSQSADAASFNSAFRNRSLSDFPCLRRMAFVATSDAYSRDDLTRFTWIRMMKPNLAGLRQAFLDYEARIACDDDARFGGRNPDIVRHGWIRSLSMGGLATSGERLEIDFDPRINVIIGGRGAGKSTVIHCLRQLFGQPERLPPVIAQEVERFRSEVLMNASLQGESAEAVSGQVAQSGWTREQGVHAIGDGFTWSGARVVSQKELFERTHGDGDRSVSANLLAMVDEALTDDIVVRQVLEVDEGAYFDPRLLDDAIESARSAHSQSALALLSAQRQLVARAALRSEIATLTRKIAALDDPSLAAMRRDAESTLRDISAVEGTTRAVDGWLADIAGITRDDPELPNVGDGTIVSSEATRLGTLVANARQELLSVSERYRAELAIVREQRRINGFDAARVGAEEMATEYRRRLEEVGVDLSQYHQLRSELSAAEERLRRLDSLAERLPELVGQELEAFAELMRLHAERRKARQAFLDQIRDRLPTLRFSLRENADPTAWCSRVHTALGLRSGDHTESISALARWLWLSNPDSASTLDERLQVWRGHLLEGRHDADVTNRVTTTFAARLRSASEAVRVSLFNDICDDLLELEFLRDEMDPTSEASWQAVSQGSPGQRSAAMLAFILSYGDQPLVLDQPEDDLDSKLVTDLIVRRLRELRWERQVIVVTHDANIPVNVDAERVIVLESVGGILRIRTTEGKDHVGPIDDSSVRRDIQDLLEGGVSAFVNRERRYDNELSRYREELLLVASRRRE